MDINKKYSHLFTETENETEKPEIEEEPEIKIVPRVYKNKRRIDIIKWLNQIVYDDYTRYYFIKEMFNKLIAIMNNNEFYSNTYENVLFTEFVNWCYFNSHDFSI